MQTSDNKEQKDILIPIPNGDFEQGETGWSIARDYTPNRLVWYSFSHGLPGGDLKIDGQRITPGDLPDDSNYTFVFLVSVFNYETTPAVFSGNTHP